ncbi:hypothetical protein [Arthrobacter sp. JCM 19049]|uniref:hypothetical protein n=1 Tax=Arthrobacter sp. JCM 19049 TaxID=1460643 RepID=UPI000A9BC303|nr:hypothetical protein [Arthrobacter sp. JCM 19049]
MRSPWPTPTRCARPFAREQYIHKFRTLAQGLVQEAEIERFLAAVQRLDELGAGELDQLNILAAPGSSTPPTHRRACSNAVLHPHPRPEADRAA